MAINANNIVPEFRERDFQAFVHANPTTDLQYRNYFSTLFNPDLKWANLEGQVGAKIMAPIVSMDSGLILKGRDFPEKIMGEIPKIEVGRSLTEKDFFRIQALRNAIQANPTNQAIKNQLIDLIYGDGRFVVDSVNARLEYMAKQLASDGKYVASQNGVDITINFSTSSTNATNDWMGTANSYFPITQLKALQKTARGTGSPYTTMLMDTTTFDRMAKSEEVQKFVATFAQVALNLQGTPTVAQVNSALTQHNLPTIQIWESTVSEENKAGSVSSLSGWVDGNILLSESPLIGNTQYTISPEAGIDLGETSKFTTDEFVLVSVLGHAKPMSVVTAGMGFATPVLNNVSKKKIWKTKLS